MTCTQERFERDVVQHQLTVIRDDGVNRHLSFRKPGTSIYWFEIVTWPGVLAIRGDCGAYMFSRVTDMFDFFRAEPDREHPEDLYINPQYWMEKVLAVSKDGRGAGSCEKFSLDVFKREVIGWFRRHTQSHWYGENREHRWAIWEAIRELLENDADTHDASNNYRLLRDFSVWIEGEAKYDFHDFFTDFWEVDCTEYDFGFIWNLYAIAWAIRQYDASKIALQQGGPENGLYFIQDTRQFVGNCVMWWGENRNGYVSRLDRAGKYTREDAQKICGSRGTDRMWPCSLIEPIAGPTVDFQILPKDATLNRAEGAES